MQREILHKPSSVLGRDLFCCLWLTATRHDLMSENWRLVSEVSGGSWMYPYQRTPMGNPYISPI